MGCTASQDGNVQQQRQSNQPRLKAAGAGQVPSGHQRKTSEPGTAPRKKDDEVTDIEIKRVKMDKDILLQYLKLEKEVGKVESKNVLKALKVKEEELNELNIRVADLERKHQQSIQETAKEKADVDELQQPSVKQYLEEQGQYDKAFTKEQEEYIEALNRQEIVKKELDGAKYTRDLVGNELNNLQTDTAKITELYRQQDELLAGIFDGKYGSELEFYLESQLDTLLERKQRVGVAKYKWQNGRVLLQHAYDQLGQAVIKWVELHNLKPDNGKARYAVATEARNSLVAAHQNISSAQRYLGAIQFPYCKPAELDTLQRATSNIYTDMATPQRHAHALNCYKVTHRRTGALLQWFDYVVENTIMKDLELSAMNMATKEQELRRERLRLIKAKIRDELGDDINLDVEEEVHEIEKEKQGEDEQDGHLEAARAITADDKVTTTTQTQSRESAKLTTTESGEETVPLPPEEMAPPPTMGDIFGNIEELKKQHEREMEEYKKSQELNKARIDQGLQEKLRARLSRRKRQLAQEQAETTKSM